MSRTHRTTDGCRLVWTSEGRGPAILLVHGFASTWRRNWESTGWIRFLVGQGFRVITYDQRGHGESDKAYEPESYLPERLADDVVEILDAAGEDGAALMGYSMGASVILSAAVRHPGRASGLLLGGIGDAFFPWLAGREHRDLEPVARALETDDPSGLPAAVLGYRRFAEANGQDLRALAACWRRPRRPPSREELAKLAVPTLVVTGKDDEVAGDPRPLAEALGGRAVVLEGKDHMSAVGAREHRAAAIDFLHAVRLSVGEEK